MTETFKFATAGRIIFGDGTSHQLPDLVAGLGDRVFVVTRARTDGLRSLIEEIPGAVVTHAVSG